MRLGFPNGLLPSDFPTKLFRHFLSPHARCMPHHAHTLWFPDSYSVRLSVQIMKILIRQFSLASCNFIRGSCK
jgi:hypothetical protein